MVRCSRFGARFWKAPRGPFHPEVSRHHRALLLWKWLTTCAAGCRRVGQGYGRFIAEYCPWVTVTSLCWHLDGLQRTVESIKNICLQSFERKSGLLRNTLCGFSRSSSGVWLHHMTGFFTTWLHHCSASRARISREHVCHRGSNVLTHALQFGTYSWWILDGSAIFLPFYAHTGKAQGPCKAG